MQGVVRHTDLQTTCLQVSSRERCTTVLDSFDVITSCMRCSPTSNADAGIFSLGPPDPGILGYQPRKEHESGGEILSLVYHLPGTHHVERSWESVKRLPGHTLCLL